MKRSFSQHSTKGAKSKKPRLLTLSQVLFYSSKNIIAQPIPRLELLDEIVEQAQKHDLVDFSQTLFVGVQHILETTATLFQALIRLGADPEKMYFSGKCYSTCPGVVKTIKEMGIYLKRDSVPEKPGQYRLTFRKGIGDMWRMVVNALETKHKDVNTIIVLDEGGHCLEEMPHELKFKYRVTGIEQTRAGLYNGTSDRLTFPLIEVASSAAKRFVEAPMIAEAAFERIKKFLAELQLKLNTVFGVIGNGAIGDAIATYLLNQGYIVVVYDSDEKAFEKIGEHGSLFRLANTEAVIANSDCIIGCTGKDITAGIDILSLIKKDKVFISCSSEDKEFLSLLRVIANLQQDYTAPLSTVSFETELGHKISILRGGFPVNFDNTAQSVPSEKIQFTRMLLLAACFQASVTASQPIPGGKTVNKCRNQCLNPHVQRYIFNLWKQVQPSSSEALTELVELFEDEKMIMEYSGGNYCQKPELESCFKISPQITPNEREEAITTTEEENSNLSSPFSPTSP